jgi:hypothetical protein
VSLLCFALLFIAANDFTSIQKKMDDIVNDRLKPGARVYMPQRELLAYEQAQAVAIAPKAVHNVTLELREGAGTSSAAIDFLELNKARGGQSNWLMDQILAGERLVKVSLRVQTRDGKARVDVERVEIGGAAMQGSALDFLIQNYVLPQFPNAKVDQWFPLEHRMDRIEIHPDGVTVVMAK